MFPMPFPRISLLGVPIDAVTMGEAVTQMTALLDRRECAHVMTPNSEMLVEAARNAQFRRVIQSAALNLPDSAGLLHAARWTRQRLPARVAGVDIVGAFCRTLNEQHPVFLLGGGPGIAARAAHALQRANPSLRIVGTYAGSPSPAEAPDIIQRINASGACVLFVAYGAPMQDLWINEHLRDFMTVRLAMGVGGTFDFLSGAVRRAPNFLRVAGLEWVWRLCLQPWRIRRIWNAAVVFPLLVLRYGRRSPF